MSVVSASAASRNALIVLAVIAVGMVAYWLRGILTPLVLAIFLLILIDGLVRGVRKWAPFVPNVLAMPFAILLIVLSFVGAVWILVDGVAGFAGQFAGATARVDALIADAAATVGLEVVPTTDELLRRLNLQQYAAGFVGQAQAFASDAFFVLVYLGFLIASRAGFERKLDGLFATADKRAEAERVFERIRSGVDGYLWVQTVTGLMIAILCWGVMAAVGLDNALFWAFVIFLIGYIPVLGGVVAGLGPPIFSLVQFDTYGPPLILFVSIQAILFVVGNFVQPKMQGDNQNIDPVAVLLGLAFWGALWGVPGMFLSTPLTVMIIAILAEFDSTRWIAVLLSGDGEPYPRNETEAARKAAKS